MPSSSDYDYEDDGNIVVNYDDLIRKIRSEFNRERNKTEELGLFVARVIALLTVARDEYHDGLEKEDD